MSYAYEVTVVRKIEQTFLIEAESKDDAEQMALECEISEAEKTQVLDEWVTEVEDITDELDPAV